MIKDQLIDDRQIPSLVTPISITYEGLCAFLTISSNVIEFGHILCGLCKCKGPFTPKENVCRNGKASFAHMIVMTYLCVMLLL